MYDTIHCLLEREALGNTAPIHTHPAVGVIGKSKCVRSFKRQSVYIGECIKPTWNFQRGRRPQTKQNHSVRGVWIFFWNKTMTMLLLSQL